MKEQEQKYDLIVTIVDRGHADYVVDEKYTSIGTSAFSGSNIVTLTINNKDLVLGEYAFIGAQKLTTVNLPEESGFEILGYFADYNFGKPAENTERWYIAARAKKI